MNSTNEPPPVSSAPRHALPGHKQRRWWRYALVGLGGLVVLAIVGAVALASYWHSLVNNYTATQPAPLPQRANAAAVAQDLNARWGVFWQAVLEDRANAPFRLSADDLNTVIATVPDLKGRLHLTITNDQIMGEFSVPLDKAKQKALQGRFVNGTARLHLAFEDGWLTAQVLDLKANGKPVPGWLQQKVQRENVLKDLDKNPDAIAFLHKLSKVEVKDGAVILTP